MTPSERIEALEGLLAKIKRNAAMPRPPSAHLFARPVANIEVAPHASPALMPTAHDTTPPAVPRVYSSDGEETTAVRKVSARALDAEADARDRSADADVEVVFDDEIDVIDAGADERDEAARRAEEWRLLEEEAAAIEAAEKAEAERLAAVRAADDELARAKAAEERAAREVAARAEAQRLTREAEAEERARVLEAARRERDEAERAAREKAEAAAREAAERAAREEAEARAREAAEREARERVEEEARRRALAEDEARLAREAAATIEREQEERARREALEGAMAEEQLLSEQAAPVSTRQPKDETRPDEPLDDEEERPPESGEVASQRKPTGLSAGERDGSAALETADDLEAAVTVVPPRLDSQPVEATPPYDQIRLLIEPAPGAPVAPTENVVVADVTARYVPAAAVAVFLDAVRAPAPATFGALLEASLDPGRSNESKARR